MPPKRKNKTLPHTENPEDDGTGTIFFYHESGKPYGKFSQWYPTTLTIPTASLCFLAEGPSPSTAAAILATYGPSITFNCAEQCFMFSKALFFSDATVCTSILGTSAQKEQKALGRTITNFDNDEWLRVKARVLRVANWYKFSCVVNKAERDVLLGTGERELAEASRLDPSCGIGYSAKYAETYRAHWGANLLGKALGVVRGRLREWIRLEMEEGEIVNWDWDGGLEDA